MNPPLVTIGLPCFNAAETVARALKSAVRQDWPNIEILVVDDMSDDGSTGIVERMIAEVPRARLIRHDVNTGPAGARNTILAEAKGEFVAFFDDDDEAAPRRVSAQIRCLEEYEKTCDSGLVACYAGGRRRYANGYEIDLPAIGAGGRDVPHGPGVVDYLLLYRRRADWFYGSGVPACSLMARRATYAAVGGFDDGLRRVEDVDLAIRLALKGCHFIGTEESLFVQYSTTAPDKSAERNLKAEQTLAARHRGYLESVGGFHLAFHWPALRYWHFKRRYLRFTATFLVLFLRHPLAVPCHLLATGPKRLRHEWRMRRRTA